MVISEKNKELLLKYFNDGNVMIEYGLNYLNGYTHCVNNIKDLNCILENSENYSYIYCYEMLPYLNISEFCRDLKEYGPYVSEKFRPENYKIVSSFYTFKNDYNEEITFAAGTVAKLFACDCKNSLSLGISDTQREFFALTATWEGDAQ